MSSISTAPAVPIVTVLVLCVACIGKTEPTAVQILTQASVAMGDLTAAGPLTIHASGTMNKSAEGQGYSPGEPSIGAYREVIAVDAGGSGVSWNYVEDRYDGTTEQFGEAYPADTLRYLLIHDMHIAVPLRAASFKSERMRLRRWVPHLLIHELLSNPTQLRIEEVGDDVHRVGGPIADSVSVIVSFDPKTSFVTQVSFDVTLPGKGPTRVQWRYDDYRVVSGSIRIPYSYGSRVGSHAYTEMSVDSVIVQSTLAFQPPDGLRTLDTRNTDVRNVTPSPLNSRELAPGLFTVPDVRSGFAPLVVEFDTFLVVVDAPASFPLLGQIPPLETDPGPSMSWATERFVDLLRREWPSKQIAYAVLTHHHEDHIGGVRALVAGSATVLAAQGTLDVARRLVELDGVSDRLAETPVVPQFESIDSRRSITDKTQTLEIISVGDNPHAMGMLVLAFPRLNTMYVSDLATPAPLGQYPASNHAALDRFLATWLDHVELSPDSIWSMHGNGVITRDHLALLKPPPA